jgi:DNA-directed RNA polymerase sigma subunit (sigma70/sigma32)
MKAGDAADPLEIEQDEGFSTEEREALGAAARRARRHDRALSDTLGSPRPSGRLVSSGYLRQLGRRPSLSPAAERKLVDAAKAGDRQARAQLVEAFLPAIAAVGRVYRGRGEIDRMELMQEGVAGCCAPLNATTPTWARRSGPTPPGGSARPCSN